MTMLSMIVYEVSWLVPWYHLLTGVDQDGALLRSYLTLGLTVALAYAVSKGLAIFQLRTRVRLLSLLGFLAVNIVVALLLLAPTVSLPSLASPPFSAPNGVALPLGSPLPVAAITVLVGWWRGIGIAQGSLKPGHAIRGFQFGLVMILLYGVAVSSLGGELRYAHFYLFLCAGLIAMISTRLSSLHRPGGRSGPADRTWLVGITVLTIGMVGLAALVAAVARGPFSALASSAARLMLEWAVRILVVILSPILYLSVRLMRGFIHLLNQATMPQTAAEPQVTPSPYDDWLNELREAEPPAWADELTIWVRGILLAAAALAILWLLLSRLRRIRAMTLVGAAEDWERTFDREGLRPALEAALRRRFYAVWDRLKGFSDRDRWEASEKVRRIYAQLMRLCSQLGMARAPSITPFEFLPALKERFPEFHSELETITRAYVRVRYGEMPETRREVDAVERAWVRVQARGQELYYEGISFFRT
jgi:hypothetical protein